MKKKIFFHVIQYTLYDGRSVFKLTTARIVLSSITINLAGKLKMTINCCVRLQSTSEKHERIKTEAVFQFQSAKLYAMCKGKH